MWKIADLEFVEEWPRSWLAEATCIRGSIGKPSQLRITDEPDSQKLNELTQQLISALDEEQTTSAKLEPADEQKPHENLA